MSIKGFANRDEDELIQAYLQNKLTPEEAIEFEVYIMDNSELLEKIQMDNLLQNSMRKIQQSMDIKPANAPFWKPLYSNVIAVASSAALFIVVGSAQLSDSEVSTNRSAIQSPSIIYLESFRGTKNTIELTFTQSETFKILAIDLPPNATGTFNLSIIDENKQAVITSALSPNANNELIFILQASTLEKGIFQLDVNQKNNKKTSFNLMVNHYE